MSTLNEDFFYTGTVQQLPLAISMGRAPGYSFVDKYGVNPSVTTATDPEDIWEFGGVYPFSTTADIVSLSSSDNGDDQKIEIYGLTLAGVEVKQTLTLTGQTVVELTTDLWRVYRMINVGTTSLAGTVYCFSGTTVTAGVPSGASVVKAIIDDGNNQTLMCVYTIPAGKVGFFIRAEVGMQYTSGFFASAAFAALSYKTRRKGKVFIVKKSVSLMSSGSSNFQDERPFPCPIPAMTDLKLSVDEVSAEIGVWGTFDILLVDEAKFTAAYLTGIGQP